MNIRSILALTDLSAQGNRIVIRAAMLAAQHRATLKLMYAPNCFRASQPVDVQDDLRQLAGEMHVRFDILVKQVLNKGGHLRAVAEEARRVDLVVVGEHREHSVKAFFCGQPIERLQRVVRCPILLVRLEVFHGYRRIVVAVDFTPESKKLVKFAWSLDNGAQVELFHALNTIHADKWRYAEVSERAMKTYWHESMLEARQRMFWLSDSSTARRNRVVSAIGKGDAARQAVIQQQHANAEVLVVGKRRSSGFTDFLLGNVAQRVLWWSTSDILLVPHDWTTGPQPELAVSSAPEYKRMTARLQDRGAA